MSYLTQARLMSDTYIRDRVAACAALEGETDPYGWAAAHAWEMSAQPNWDAAYASAIANENPAPGADESVIPDAWILSAVQSIRGAV